MGLLECYGELLVLCNTSSQTHVMEDQRAVVWDIGRCQTRVLTVNTHVRRETPPSSRKVSRMVVLH